MNLQADADSDKDGAPGDERASRTSASGAVTMTMPLGKRSRQQIFRETTETYLATLGAFGHASLPTPEELEPQLMARIEGEFTLENMAFKASGGVGLRLMKPTSLPPLAIAMAIQRLFRIVVVRPSGISEGEARARGMLARYEWTGPDAGLYVGRPEYMRSIVRRFDSGMSKESANLVLDLVRSRADVVEPNDNRDLIAVNNGIFDFVKKELMPFSPEHIFLSKVRTNYDLNAVTSPTIINADGSEWEIEKWAKDLFDDEERTQLLWEVLGATVRPLVSWNKAVYPFDEDGENGKGTFLVLVRCLVGAGSWVSIPIAEFANKFQLAQIVNKSLVVTDENDVGSFSDRLANYKAAITGDVITIEEKFEKPYSYVPKVFVIQCLNSFPKAKDTSRSHYRRQLFWPFSKSFTGSANALIKEDYLMRREVLEYVLHRVLHAEPFYKLSEPKASRKVLGEFKNLNDPVRACWDDIERQLVWDMVPTAFLYELYVAWTERYAPNGKAVGIGEFGRRIGAIVRETGHWEQGTYRPGTQMDELELLIERFDLQGWMNPNYSGTDASKRCRPILLDRYRGFKRSGTWVADDDDDDDGDLDRTLGVGCESPLAA
jgi:putative DNA primase/helicase